MIGDNVKVGIQDIACFAKYGVLNFAFEAGAWFRTMNPHDKKFSHIRRFRNRFRGKRCFICATGPSLNVDDLEKIKGEYCFGVNSICEVYSLTEWRPDFYVFQDYPILEHYGDDIDNRHTKILVGTPLVNDRGEKKISNKWIKFPLNCYYQMFDFLVLNKAKINFSSNSYIKVYGGFTVTYSAIQLAVYMGFKEIYLLGVDCNYKPGTNNHFRKMKNEFRRTAMMSDGERKLQIKAYRVSEVEARKRGCTIINVSRGGELDVFPRKKLEDILT